MINRANKIKEFALAGGKALKSVPPSDGVATKEGLLNIVTAGDLASEKAIISAIRQSFPRDAILAEETSPQVADLLSIDRLWVIDPIDGTINFRYQRNYSAVSVGYVEKGVVKLSAVYDPFRNELFFAQAGQGAYLNNQPIAVGSQTDIHKTIVTLDPSYDPAIAQEHLDILQRIKPLPWFLIGGSAVRAMCDVACGRADMYYNNNVKPWDNAAAMLIVEKSGGIVKNIKNEEIDFTSKSIVVGNKTLLANFFAEINK